MDRSALERELERLLERHEERPEGRAFAPLADCHRKLGNFEEATELLREGLKRHPDYSAARVILGKLHLDTGRDELARKAFTTVLALDPFNLVARRHIARLCEQSGDLREAREHWRQLSLAEPNAQDAFDALVRLGVEIDAPKPEAESPPAPRRAGDVAVLEASLEPDVEPEPTANPTASVEVVSEQPAEPEEEPESAAAAEPEASSSEAGEREGIVTATLARIYREQGFAARALEIYEQLQREQPAPEFERAAKELRAELGRQAPRPPRPIETLQSEEPEADAAEPATSRPEPETAVPASAGAAAEAKDRARTEAEQSGDSDTDFQQFRTWLGRIKVRG